MSIGVRRECARPMVWGVLMRVLYLTQSFGHDNGWAHYSIETVSAMAGRGIECWNVAPAAPQEPTAGKFIRRPLWSRRPHGRFRAARAVVDAIALLALARRVDAIHALVEPMALAAAILGVVANKPVFVTLHGTYSISLLKGRNVRINRWAFRRAECLFAVSRYTRRRFLALEPSLSDRVKAVPLGIRRRTTGEGSPPAAKRECAVLTVGAVKPRKGHVSILSALKSVVHHIPDARYYVAGKFEPENNYCRKVLEKANQLGLNGNVKFLGHVGAEELESLYRKVRVLVVASENHGDHFEGFGLVHLEANQHGVPTIGSLDSGNEDAVAQGRSGFLVRQGDSVSLAKAICTLLQSDEDWNRMSRDAKAISDEMSWERLADAYTGAMKDAGVDTAGAVVASNGRSNVSNEVPAPFPHFGPVKGAT